MQMKTKYNHEWKWAMVKLTNKWRKKKFIANLQFNLTCINTEILKLNVHMNIFLFTLFVVIIFLKEWLYGQEKVSSCEFTG